MRKLAGWLISMLGWLLVWAFGLVGLYVLIGSTHYTNGAVDPEHRRDPGGRGPHPRRPGHPREGVPVAGAAAQGQAQAGPRLVTG